LVGSRGRIVGGISRSLLELQFKAEYRFDIGMPHWLARLDHALEPFHLGNAFLGRHKPFHFRAWYRNALAGYVQAILLDPRTLSRPYINPQKLESIVRSHVSGNGNYTTELHKVLSLELVHRLFFDNPGREVGRSPLSPSVRTAALAS
jgi:asparagine synthase (glutamine-hydrolysing)